MAGAGLGAALSSRSSTDFSLGFVYLCAAVHLTFGDLCHPLIHGVVIGTIP